MHGEKIAVVTGANDGIGFETAAGLAAAGFKVVMACRNGERAERARARLQKRMPTAGLAVMLVDLSDFDSVRRFAAAYRDAHDRLDVLVNNAGILDYSGRKAPSGIELQFATNHLGHFLLTALLIDLMPDDPASRIVSLGSIAHKGAAIRFDDIACESASRSGAAYGQSKLACVLFGLELDRRLKAAGSRIRSIPVHPGGSDSGLFDDMSRAQYYTLKLLAPFITHSNAAAAKPSLFAALDPVAASGAYYGPQGFMEMKGPVGIARLGPAARDAGTASRLWALSEEMTGQTFRVPGGVQDLGSGGPFADNENAA